MSKVPPPKSKIITFSSTLDFAIGLGATSLLLAKEEQISLLIELLSKIKSLPIP